MNDIPNIVRADFIAKHRARVTVIQQAERDVREGLEVLDACQQGAWRFDITALLTELGYEYEIHDGLPALFFSSEQDRTEFLLEFGHALARYLPRRAKAAMGAVRADGGWLTFGAPAEPDGSDYPYEAASSHKGVC